MSGDIISFRKVGEIITHRIIRKETNENGNEVYITKGDNNSIEDRGSISYQDIEGKYQFKLNGFGTFLEMLESKTTLIILIILMILNITYSKHIKQKKIIRKIKRETYEERKNNMFNYKAIFIDIDGTLRNDKKEISIRTKEIIKKFVEKGILIVICSGRQNKNVEQISIEANCSPYIITSNGAQVFDYEQNKTIFLNPMDKKACKKIYNIAIQNDCKFIMNLEEKRVITRLDDSASPSDILLKEPIDDFIEKHNIMQCLIQDYDFEKIKSLKSKIEEIKEVEIKNQSRALTNPKVLPNVTTYYDIADINTSKGLGVREFCKYCNINSKETIAIGDDYNDVPMFQEVGLAIAMGNANDDVKAKADLVTKTNNEDGVAFILEKLIQDF